MVWKLLKKNVIKNELNNASLSLFLQPKNNYLIKMSLHSALPPGLYHRNDCDKYFLWLSRLLFSFIMMSQYSIIIFLYNLV